jgi:hypothetical protein
MILETTADLKEYIAISDSFVFTDFEPYIKKAINKFTRAYVGNLHEELENESAGENAEIKNEAREHLRNAIANFSWFLYIPLAQLMIDSSGISIATNADRKSPEWWQIKDLRRECLQSGHEAMDLLFEILEKNPTVFPDYTSNYSTINRELIVSNAVTFSKYYHINNSRHTYLALQPTIRLVEDQFIKKFLCPELISQLKGIVTGKKLEVQTAIHKAIVAFTVSKVANIGLFILDDSGLKVNFDTFIDGRRENVSYGKSADQVQSLVSEQSSNGLNYLQEVTEIISDNISEFTMCDFPLLSMSNTSSGYSSYDTKGLLGL